MTRTRWGFGIAVLVMAIFFVDFCALVFQCGCRSLWNGISTYCNIHAASGPHCPWCEHPLAGGGVAFGAALLAQWAVFFLPNHVSFGMRLWQRCALAVVAFPLAAAIVALVQGLVWGYWR